MALNPDLIASRAKAALASVTATNPTEPQSQLTAEESRQSPESEHAVGALATT